MRVSLDFFFTSQSEIDEVANICEVDEAEVREVLELTSVEIPCRPVVGDKLYVRDYVDYFPESSREIVSKMVNIRFIIKTVIIRPNHLLCVCEYN